MKVKYLLALLLLTACTKTGAKGDKGDPGTSNLYTNQGQVPSDDFVVSDSHFLNASGALVYVTDSSGAVGQLNAYLPGAGKNAFFLLHPATESVEIFNAKTFGAVTYLVVVEQ